ncbi:Fe-S cluster assembly sulfur transfer protein SufU [Alkalihalobacterium bogoriense]|uniref:Fe-S cluster assembly sulfur transfer protein SufU n=1 Tax=Alkalihalobacterium bogoriense TaxID=246272 RepID=UPI00047C7E01|nr:SUF system NifU family Fe-S cluster assembly protein [Alkalihalobacterium bogoriense]
MLDNLYHSVVLDHAKSKRNHRKTNGNNTLVKHYKNPTCGDVMTLYVNVSEENTIRDISFVGEGCSISMASCSMMTTRLKGVTLEEAFQLREAMETMIRKGIEPESIDLGDAIALKGVHQLKARHNCALMPWQAFDRIFQ